ncbi:MAG: glycosyl transferase [Ruminococcaceae bacterium]|nr:glycosyl transferase [Oscillospiraceae bacterium]
MNKFKKIKKYFIGYIKGTKERFFVNSKLGFYNHLSDREYLEKEYKAVMGYPMDFDNPKRFTEKLQWLKVYNRKPIYSDMVDKYKAKEFVAQRIGEEHIIPLLGVWDRFEDIDFDVLPDQFVLKCNHDSAGLVICKDKSKLNKKAAAKKLNRCLKRDYSFLGKEWPYKNVKPKIIAEKYMIDSETNELRDYKFFCCNGKVKCFRIDFDRFIAHKTNYYDPQGNPMMFGLADYPPDYTRDVKIPKNLDKMIEYAEILSSDTPFLRVDFYEVDNVVYFGELTFYPGSGYSKFTDDKWDFTFGDWITLPEKKEENI